MTEKSDYEKGYEDGYKEASDDYYDDYSNGYYKGREEAEQEFEEIYSVGSLKIIGMEIMYKGFRVGIIDEITPPASVLAKFEELFS